MSVSMTKPVSNVFCTELREQYVAELCTSHALWGCLWCHAGVSSIAALPVATPVSICARLRPLYASFHDSVQAICWCWSRR